jgi:hypothetical protein
MAFSDIDICNLALSRMGASRISSFSDNTLEAQECNAVYNMVKRYVQAKGPWACNKLRVNLPQTTITPAFGFAYAYQMPVSPECLRMLKINEDQTSDINFQIENGLLLCDEPSVSILYLGLIDDPIKFGPYLEESIVDHLVAQMNYKFTGQLSGAQQAIQYAANNMKELLTLDSLQGNHDTLPSDTYINVRFNAGSDDGQRPF